MSGGALLEKLLLVMVTVFMRQEANSSAATMTHPCSEGDSWYKDDYLCNNGTIFACVCYKGANNNNNNNNNNDNKNGNDLSKRYPDCRSFIKSPYLPVVKLSVEFPSNSKAKMPDEYFKRYKVASTIERYCMNGTHECQGTTLPIKKDTNVVVLNIACSDRLHSTIYYTVAKPMNPKNLTIENTMAPEKIIFIMNSTLTSFPWEVISTEAKLLEHTPDEITIIPKTPAARMYDHFHENILFFIILIVIGLVVGLIYIIAIVKVIRDHKRKTNTNKRDRNKNQQDNPNTATPNYGSINHTTTDAQAASSSGGGRYVEFENQKSSSRQNSTVISITMPSSSSHRASVQQQQQPERPAVFIAPLRVGDVDAYEAAEPDYQSPTSLFNYLISRFKIGKLIKTTSTSSFRRSERGNSSGFKKSRTVHQTLSSPDAASKALILQNIVDVNELKDFQVQSRSRNETKNGVGGGRHVSATIIKMTPPEIKIDFEYAQAPVDEDFYPDSVVVEESREDVTTVAVTTTSTTDFADFDNFPAADDDAASAAIVNGHHNHNDQYAMDENNADENWPPPSSAAAKFVEKPIVASENLHNSLSAAAILTSSYTEENLIKSETSSLAESRSNSESDLSEHSLNLNPLADYQPLRESTWSVNRQE